MLSSERPPRSSLEYIRGLAGLVRRAGHQEIVRDRLRRVPMGVPLTPHDIAKAVLYFSCEDSAGVTGTSLVIDGGYLAAAEWQHPGTTRFMEPL